MTDELYQEIILEHARRPHNAAPLSGTPSLHERNTLCGDELTLFLQQGEHIDQVACVATGCALSRASASLMTDALQGKTPDQAKKLISSVQNLATGSDKNSPDPELAPLASVAGYPARVKCVTMVWHAAQKMLDTRGAASGKESA